MLPDNPVVKQRSITVGLISVLAWLVCARGEAHGTGYVVDATGYREVIVNGETLLRDGVDTGRRPGRVLRA